MNVRILLAGLFTSAAIFVSGAVSSEELTPQAPDFKPLKFDILDKYPPDTSPTSILLQEAGLLDEFVPYMRILGDNPFKLTSKEKYLDLGAIAYDKVDGRIDVVVESNTVDTDQAGSYEVVYRATDAVGNSSTAIRVVVVEVNQVDEVAPVITLLGDNPAQLGFQEVYVDAGATAFDEVDGVVDVVIESNIVDTDQAGRLVDVEPRESTGELAQAIASLEAQGLYPVLDRTNTFTDNDQNGVRDDIDTYIENLNESGELTLNLKQYAKTVQSQQVTDTTNDDLVNAANDEFMMGFACVLKATGDLERTDEHTLKIEAYTANTIERLRASLRFTMALNGKIFSVVNKPVCDGDV